MGKHVGMGWVLLLLAAVGAWAVSARIRAAEGVALPPAPAPGVAAAISPDDVDAFLAPFQPALDASVRPVLRLDLSDFPQDTLDASKVGGRAWWPADEPDPSNAAGQPMVLLAQLDFAQMPSLPGYPAQGLLQFFISADEYYGASMQGLWDDAERATQRNFRIVYWPDTDRAARGLPTASSDLDYLPHQPEKPRRIRFIRDDEGLSFGDYRFEALLGGNAYAATEAHAVARGLPADDFFNAVFERRSGHGHKVGGYPHFTQTDPRTGGDWELLLQLDSDDMDGLQWGDVGVANFFIAPADLARADFSRVMYTWDCY